MKSSTLYESDGIKNLMKRSMMAIKGLHYFSIGYVRKIVFQALFILGILWLTFHALGNGKKYKIVCYFGSWATFRKGDGKFDIPDIDPTLCTHLIYGLAGITEDGEIDVLDKWTDLEDDWGKAGFKNFINLRELSPRTKFMISIGGANQDSERYSTVMANPSLRSKFVRNVVEFVLFYGFDGFDIDWEFPNENNGHKADVKNFVLLLKELRESFYRNGLILSAAVAAAEYTAKMSYDIPEISKYVDFINLLTYDYHGVWEQKTGHNAPLYTSRKERTEHERFFNVNASINYWLNEGAPPEKLILGTAFYGKSFTLKDFAENDVGSPITGLGKSGLYTKERGMLAYYEICKLIAYDSWARVWDTEQHVPYAYIGDQWVSYDDAKSITEKAEYIKEWGLGGAMVWSIETDDFRGICGKEYPLLNALNLVLRSTG